MIDYSNEEALVLFSGGQDSTTCLYWANNNLRKSTRFVFLTDNVICWKWRTLGA